MTENSDIGSGVGNKAVVPGVISTYSQLPVGSGAAGLITAHTLIQDGFSNVQVVTRDQHPGGVWSPNKVYPGLFLNNVHGEYRFSPLPMTQSPDAKATGGRLSGDDMSSYMRDFTQSFLKDTIRYNTNVLNIRRSNDGDSGGWIVTVCDNSKNTREELHFDKVIVCTGGCSTANFPKGLEPAAAKSAHFHGPVLHSSEFSDRMGEILDTVGSASETEHGHVVVIGGGKSAQDVASYLAGKGRKVSLIFETTDAFVAAPIALPGFIRKSRFLAVMTPYSTLRTGLEQFLHRTWLGSTIVRGVWKFLSWSSYNALAVPSHSPLRRSHSLFWSIRVNDEGIRRPDNFFSLVNEGKIDFIAPARAAGYGADGTSVVLTDGRGIKANAVVLATGYTSSWASIFDQATMDELGLSRHPPGTDTPSISEWDYESLKNPPPARPDSEPDSEQWASSIYRGIVPAENILRRDFAVNGASFTTNPGYVFEVTAHWIASYLRGDKFLQIPTSPGKALAHTEREAAWMRKRFPDVLLWANESYSSITPFWNWPQYTDELLEDMNLPSMRSGGNWITWPFKVLDVKEIETLTEEREAKRMFTRSN